MCVCVCASQLLERLHRQENELSSIKAKLHETQNRNLELEKEKEDRYTKMRAEVFDNSVQLIQGHQWAHEQSTQRIAHLEEQVTAHLEEQVTAGSANVGDLRRECTELQDAIEELEEERDQVNVAHEAARRQISTLETHNEELAHRLEERHFLEQESHTVREMQQAAERAQSAERITHLERELDQAQRQISTPSARNRRGHDFQHLVSSNWTNESSWTFEYGGVGLKRYSVPVHCSYTSSLSKLPQQFALRHGEFSFLLVVEDQPANGFFFRTGHLLPLSLRGVVTCP